MTDGIDLKEAQRLFRIKAKYQQNYNRLKTDRAIQIIKDNTDQTIKSDIVSTGIILIGSWITSVAILSLF